MSDDQLDLFGDKPTPPRVKRRRKKTQVDLWKDAGVELKLYQGKLWPVEGDVTTASGHPFCRVCRSHFCPHARPSIYGLVPPPKEEPRGISDPF